MGIVLEEWKRVLDFVNGPHIPITLSILSFLSVFPILFFIWGNLFFLTIFFEIILWVVGLVLAFAAGFAMTNLKEKSIKNSIWEGAKVLFFLHVPRYIVAIIMPWIFYYAMWGSAESLSVELDLLLKNVIPGIASLGMFVFLFTLIMGMTMGGLGGLIGKGLGKVDRLGSTMPTRKNWKN
jgi:hypothetical protein